MSLAEKIVTYGSKNIDQHNLFIHHRRSVKTVRRKVKDIAGRSDSFFARDKKTDAPADDKRHLFVRMCMFRRDQKGRETKTANHHLFAYDHLSVDAFGRMLHRNGGPIQMLRLVGFLNCRHSVFFLSVMQSVPGAIAIATGAQPSRLPL